MAIRATRSLAICKAKAVYVTSFLSHFKAMNVGLVPGIEPSTSRSAVKLSTDWANPRGGGGYSHTLPIRLCAVQRGRDFEAPDLERSIHFRGVFYNGV